MSQSIPLRHQGGGLKACMHKSKLMTAPLSAQEPPLLRAIIAFSAAATLLYTPLLKRVTGVKTATVAAIIALSPMAGALAAGAVRPTAWSCIACARPGGQELRK